MTKSTAQHVHCYLDADSAVGNFQSRRTAPSDGTTTARMYERSPFPYRKACEVTNTQSAQPGTDKRRLLPREWFCTALQGLVITTSGCKWLQVVAWASAPGG